MIYLMMIDTEESKRKFVILYEKYRYLMIKVAYDILGDRFLAEDAVHETFIKITQNMDRIGDVDAQGTKRFLITITQNIAIDIYRKRKIQVKKEVFMEELNNNEIPITYIETDLENCILDILKNLPDKYKEVFLLKYSCRLSNDEIADILGISEGNIRQRILRGKELVKESISKLEGVEYEMYRDNG